MVLKRDYFSKSRRKIMEDIWSTVILIGFIYLILSIFHLAWYIAKPEGFWGFTYFIEILRVILFSIPIFIILLVIPILFYNYILKIIKNGVKGYTLIRGLGFLILIILTIIFK